MRIAILIVSLLFFPLCVSTPINYDTAEVNPGRGKVVVGVGGKGFSGRYSACGGTYTYAGGGVRGDVQAGYGINRAVEVGAQGGVFGGTYKEEPTGGGTTQGLDASGRDAGASGGNGASYFLMADAYVYAKLTTPTKGVRLALKVAPGAGFMTYGDGSGFYPIGYTDILLGFGSPERFTLGVRISPVEGLIAMGGVHFGTLILSLSLGGDLSDGGMRTLSAGLGLRLK